MAAAYSPLIQCNPHHHHEATIVGPKAISYEDEDSGSLSSSKDSWTTASKVFFTPEPASLLLQQPVGYTNTKTPGQRAPSRHGRGDLSIEQGRVTCGECCKCCKSWDDWCLFLSCNCSTSFHLPMHKRKCLRAARTEGWRLLWSFLLPLTVGSVPLHLIWPIAQVTVAIASLLLVVGLYYSDSHDIDSCSGLEFNKINYVSSLTCSGVWLFLSWVDIMTCMAMSRFDNKTLVTKFRVYITPLRILYSFLCLLPLILVNYYFQTVKFTCTDRCMVKWCGNKVLLYFSIISFFFFVDFVCLVIVVLFALKSLKVRNAYSQAIGGPGKREGICSFECYFVFCIFGEVAMHVLLILFACSFAFKGQINVYSSPDTDVNSVCGTYLMTSSQMSVILSFIVPVAGIVSICYNNYLHFQKYLINVYLSLRHLSQDRESAAQLGIPADVYEKLRVRQLETQYSNRTVSYLENFKKEIRWSTRFTHPCFSPFAIISSTIASSMLVIYIYIRIKHITGYPDVECTHFLLVQLISVTVIFCLIHVHDIFTFVFIYLSCLFCCVIYPTTNITSCCNSSTCRCENYIDSIP